jgi:hypothetical protein
VSWAHWLCCYLENACFSVWPIFLGVYLVLFFKTGFFMITLLTLCSVHWKYFLGCHLLEMLADGVFDHTDILNSSVLKMSIFFFFLLLVGLRFWTQGFAFANQVLYFLSYTSSPFCSGYFGDGGLKNYLPGLASNHDLSLPHHS